VLAIALFPHESEFEPPKRTIAIVEKTQMQRVTGSAFADSQVFPGSDFVHSLYSH
jgi:hypothetical protein